MRKKTIFLFVVGTMGLLGCPHLSHYCDEGYCDPKEDGGADVSAPDGTSDTSTDATTDRDPPPPGCDTPTEPLKNPEKCLVDSFGVFVSAGGADTNDGTKQKPFKTVGKALASGRGRVVVCEGTYTESLEIKADVELYSGVTCDFAKAGGKAKLVATKPEYAVSVGTVTALLADLEVTAAAGTAGSPNSIGVWSVDATKLTLRGVAVSAKEGFKGDDGAPGGTGAYVVGNGNGNPADMNNPGGGKSCTCNSGGLSGGGAGGLPGVDASNGGQALGGAAPKDGAGGVMLASCATTEPNGTGNNGADRMDAPAAGKLTVPGTLSASEAWVPGEALSGTSGLPGQGGGGGGSRGAMSYGGGGGCGGCGGTGGKGGKSGGASIALLSVRSNVTMSGVSLVAGTGGTGGTGGGGGPGAAGGGSLSGCSGGDGGKGGPGGAGAGGAGGLSVPVVYKGTKPGGDATYRFEAAASGGTGGAPGVNDGPMGLAQNELEVP